MPSIIAINLKTGAKIDRDLFKSIACNITFAYLTTKTMKDLSHFFMVQAAIFTSHTNSQTNQGIAFKLNFLNK